MKPFFALSLSVALVLFSALLLSSCEPKGPPKEIEYKKLDYADNFFTDPETGKGFTGIARQYHSNKKLKSEIHFKNGRFHGPWKDFYENGKPLAETEFKNGKRSGKNIEWTETGLLYQERVYDDDKIVSEKQYPTGR
jgi:antitoxin component YwqK of YwqJK toxin-antitoxin module